MILKTNLTIEQQENVFGDVHAGNDSMLLRDDLGVQSCLRGNNAIGGSVARSHVLLEGQFNTSNDLFLQWLTHSFEANRGYRFRLGLQVRLLTGSSPNLKLSMCVLSVLRVSVHRFLKKAIATRCTSRFFAFIFDSDATRFARTCVTKDVESMKNLQLTEVPATQAEMLIRRPPAQVFEAFVDPEITRKFWFTKSTGRLETGKHVVWTWEMHDHSIDVNVKEIEANKRILIEWGNYGSMTAVEWIFTPYENESTYVTIKNSGFSETETRSSEMRLIRKGGFTWVLAGLKALLEHNVDLNAIQDAFPKGLRK